jgi:hypothetical protein
MVSLLEKWQLRALELEADIKKMYDNKKLAKQLITGAKQEADFAYKTERDVEWYVTYCKALETRK